MLGQRERAVNEYSKAKQTNDDTGSAQQVAEGFLKKAYSEGGTPVVTPRLARRQNPGSIPPPASGEKPVLKKAQSSSAIGIVLQGLGALRFRENSHLTFYISFGNVLSV